MQAYGVGEERAEGLHIIEAEFRTEHLMIRGEIISVDTRLSDHLNSSTATIQVRPFHSERTNGTYVELAGQHASITKAHILFVLPIVEPGRVDGTDNNAWMQTVTRRAWAGLGRYSVAGNVHTEQWRDPRLLLRSFEQKQFFPLTDAQVQMPDGSTREYPIVIVNRAHVEVLSL